MATAYTIAQLQASKIAAAAIDHPGTPGRFMAEWLLDGSKKATVVSDTLDFLEFPAYAAAIIDGASITTITPGTASTTIDLQLAGTDMTGLTGYAADAAAGTQLVKLASGANTVVNTSSVSEVRAQLNTGGIGSGVYKIRVSGLLLQG